MNSVAMQVTVGYWQPCHASASSRTSSIELYLQNRVSPLQMDTLVLSALSSGGSASGLNQSLTTVCQPTMVGWFLCIRLRRMSFGVLCWRRPMQSLCPSLFSDVVTVSCVITCTV